MDAIAGLSFAEPRLLVVLAAMPLAAWFLFARERARRRTADAFVSERIRGVAFPARMLRPALLTLGLLGLALAVAGPRIGFDLVPVLREEGSTIIAIDVSSSMAAEDLGVSRLDAAQAIVRRILAGERARVALVAFESIGELIAPLTTDTQAVADLADSLSPGELAMAGSDLGAAILTATEYLVRSGSGPREIVLISDGEDQGSLAAEAIEAARKAGVRVSTITIGTEEGSTIPSRDGGEPLRDEQGEIIVTRASPASMRELAEKTGGAALVNPFDGASLAAAESRGMREQSSTEDGRTRRVPRERYQWPLAAGVILLLAGSFVNRGAE